MVQQKTLRTCENIEPSISKIRFCSCLFSSCKLSLENSPWKLTAGSLENGARPKIEKEIHQALYQLSHETKKHTSYFPNESSWFFHKYPNF